MKSSPKVSDSKTQVISCTEFSSETGDMLELYVNAGEQK